MLVVLAMLVLVVGMARNHAPVELAALGGLLLVAAAAARFLARDLRRHPSNFPDPTVSHGLRISGSR
jgi:hypothetical protein